MNFPGVLPGKQQQKLDSVVEESNRQVKQMIDLLNRWLQLQQVDLSLSVEEIMKEDARKLLRERHVAKAIRLKLEEHAISDEDYFQLLQKIYGGKPSEKRRKMRRHFSV